MNKTLFEYCQPITIQITDSKKATQRNTIISMLQYKPCHCGEFLQKGIAQYNARILELRKQGHNIIYDNLTKRFMLEVQNDKI